MCKEIELKDLDKYFIYLNEKYDNVITIGTNTQLVKHLPIFALIGDT